MINILFVDDDPLILAGLKRLFRRYGDEWQMDFVTSGDDALMRLAAKPFDVIVSDMRMPGMDGGELLRRVREKYPGMVRVILSGQSSHEAAFRTLGPAHQYLSKPCDPKTLRDTLLRAFALRQRLTSPQLQVVVSRIASLPSLPQVFNEILAELNSPKATVARVGEIISRDVAMTAKLMQLVNSSYFGLSNRVTCPMHAAGLLGLNLLKSLVMSVGVFNQFKKSPASGFSLDEMVNHSIEVGQLAKRVAQNSASDEQLEEDSLLAGMLHDVGKLALATSPDVNYGDVLRLVRQKELSLWHAERAVLGVSHAEVGGYLLSLWGLPQSVVEAVAFHHEPSDAGADRMTALAAVHVANCVAHRRNPQAREDSASQLDQPFLTSIGLQSVLTHWVDEQVGSSPLAKAAV